MNSENRELLEWMADVLVERDEEGIELSSGQVSDLYFNVKKMAVDDELEGEILEEASKMIEELSIEYDVMVGEGMGGTVTVPVLAQICGENYGMLRDEPKDYGMENLCIGADLEDKAVLIVDDVYTTGGSAVETSKRVEELGGTPEYFFTIVDRSSDNMKNLKEEGVEAYSLFESDEILKYFEE